MNRIFIGVGAILLTVAPSTSGAAIPTLSAQTAQPPAEALIEEALQQLEAELLTPGPVVSNWTEGGVSIDAALEAREGGKQGNYVLSEDQDGDRTLTIFAPASLPALIPSTWVSIAEHGSFDAVSTDSEMAIAHLDGPHFVVMRGRSRRVGNALCSLGGLDARLYEAPEAAEEAELDPDTLDLIFRATVRRVEQHEICFRYDPEGTGYRVRYFLPDGRSLPGMDAWKEKAVVVEASPLEQLLMRGD